MPPAAHRDLVRKAFGVVETEALGERQIRVVVSTGQIDRSGDVVVQDGIDCANFKRSRTVLWNHDQDHPVAQCVDIGIKADRLEATAEFPPPGISAKADEVYGLLKAGVINAASIGFLPLDVEPVDGRNARKGLRIGASELMEFSFVSVPANSGAEVLQRAFRAKGGSAESPKLTIKGLYAVAQLARLLDMLGWQVDESLAERAREGDASDVPDQLRQAMNGLGTALVAMTSEEVAELLAGKDDDGAAFAPDVDDGPMLLAMLGVATKAGRKISAATDTAMRGHLAKVAQGCEMAKSGCDMANAGHGEIVKMLDGARQDDDAEDDDDLDQKAAAQARRAREVATLRLA